MTERKATPAQGITGFLLYSPVTQRHFFRIYDAEDKSKYTDYDLCVEDMEITINDRFVSLYEGERNMLNYSPEVLGKPWKTFRSPDLYDSES